MMHKVRNASSSNSATATSSKGNGDKLRYISKYLVQYISDACQQNKETTVRISGVRVLTSDKCVAIVKKSKTTAAREREEKTRMGTKEKGERGAAKKKKALAAERKALADEKKALAAAKRAEMEARKSRGANIWLVKFLTGNGKAMMINLQRKSH